MIFMKKRMVSLLFFLSLTLLTACGQEETQESEDSAVPVEIATVETGNISAEHNVSGQVASSGQEAVVVAQQVKCTKVYVAVGDKVTQGQTLCTLDVAKVMESYNTAKTGYAQAQAQYREQEISLSAQVSKAQVALDVAQANYDAGTGTQAQVQTAKLALEGAKMAKDLALSQVQSGLQQAKTAVDQLEASLSNIQPDGSVLAPVTGTVLSLSATENNYITPTSPLAVIDKTEQMQIKAGVSESLIPKLEVGGQVKVTVASANQTFDGTIASASATPDQMTRLYPVTIQVPADAAQGLLSGMFADVVFYTDTQKGVVVVPTQAIQTGAEGQYVYTIDNQNLAHKIPVTTGLVGTDKTEITGGLAGGERLVTVGQFYLSEGVQVRVVKPEVTE